MKIIKKILIVLILLTAAISATFYYYISTLPSAPPEFIDAGEVNDNIAERFQCSQSPVLREAYRVEIDIESVLNGQTIYSSQINFNTQLEQANDSIVKGIARDIKIKEQSANKKNHQKTIKDTYFLSRIDANPYAIFTAFNHLGLSEKHPMKIIGQLLKNLSVGNDGNNYHYAYDSLQRTYRYTHNNQQINRDSQVTTANLNQLANTLQGQNKNSLWQIELDDNCLPKSLTSQEYQGISAAGHSGYIKFHIEAIKIPSFFDLSKTQMNNYTNSSNNWHAQEIASSKFEKSVSSNTEMWNVFNNFDESKNTAKLTKAVEFLIENSTSDELASHLEQSQLNDTSKRDIAFGLSLSNHDNAEAFIIDTLSSLNASATQGSRSNDAQNDVDLQQVRLMVALSGSGKISEEGFQALSKLSQDTQQNSNIQNNALINMASSLKQLENQGLSSPVLEEQLTDDLSNAIKGKNAASAILAAGNSNAVNLDSQILSKLSSPSDKERYAAGSVLARKAEHTDELLNHLNTESSDLVRYAILSNLDKDQLSAQQINSLEDIAINSSPDMAKVIRQMIQ